MSEDRLLWVDIETTNLTPETGVILELGLWITDLDGAKLESFSSVVHYNESQAVRLRDKAPEFVRDMHDKSGLWYACSLDTAMRLSMIEGLACQFLNDHDMVGQPMCGSSLRLDRNFIDVAMPTLASFFHYRSIDNSTIKEVCRRYNPDLFKRIPLASEKAVHRVDVCLDGSVEEFRFYKDNFIFDGRVESEPCG